MVVGEEEREGEAEKAREEEREEEGEGEGEREREGEGERDGDEDAMGTARRLAAQLASTNRAREQETSADAEEFRALLVAEQAKGGARTSGRRKGKKGEEREREREREREKVVVEEPPATTSSMRVGRAGGVRLSGSFVMKGGKLEAESAAKTLKSPRLWPAGASADDVPMQSPRSLEFKRKDQEDYRSHDVRIALAKHAHHDEVVAEAAAAAEAAEVASSPKRASSGRRKRRSTGPEEPVVVEPTDDYPDADKLTSEVDAEAEGEAVEVFVQAGRPRTGSILRSHAAGAAQAALLSPRKKVSLGGETSSSLGAVARAAATSSPNTLAVPFAGDDAGPAPIASFWTAFDEAVAAAVAKATSSLTDAGTAPDLAGLHAQLAAKDAEIKYLRAAVDGKAGAATAAADSSSSDSDSSSEELMVQVEQVQIVSGSS
jgi:hypothetical protein